MSSAWTNPRPGVGEPPITPPTITRVVRVTPPPPGGPKSMIYPAKVTELKRLSPHAGVPVAAPAPRA